MQTVLLTGAASGIGREAALQFAASGWRVLAVDRDEKGLDRLLGMLDGRGHRALPLDLASVLDIADLAMLDCTIDALVNNAGISDSSGTALVSQSEEQLDRVYALNFEAPTLIFRAMRDHLAANARVVNVASGAGVKAIPFRGAYSASKAGLIAKSHALAKACPELTVTCLCPGFVRTDLVENLIASGRLDPEQAVAKIPLGRMASTAEMARMIVFLASTDARGLTGQTVIHDGGSSVYGGSARILPSKREVVSTDAGTRYTLVNAPEAWARAMAQLGTGTYPAVIDFSPLKAPAGQLRQAVLRAASSFAAEHEADAALTIMLPASHPEDWEQAGDVGAAEMLVHTLACELAPRALRVNAIRLRGQAADRAPLLAFIAGVEAQFMTGQILKA